MKSYYVYILSNKRNTVLYTGVTNNINRRVSEHKSKQEKGFSSKYNICKLVYYERFNGILGAIKREKQIKGYTRRKKETLINRENPQWEDLFLG
jgi:putative endonuclease